MIEPRYCTVADPEPCEEPAYRKGLCARHLKQHQRGRPFAPRAEELSPEERLLLAADALREASSEDDREYERRRRATIAAGYRLGQIELGERIRRGLLAAKRRGVQIGRPPKVDPSQVLRLWHQCGGRIALVAQMLGITRVTVWAHVKKVRLSKHRRPSNGEER